MSIDIIGSTTSRRKNQAHIANKLLLNFSKMDRIGIVDFNMESSFDHYQYQSQFDNMTMDASSCSACYKNAITDACTRFVPKVKISTKPSPRLFTPEVSHQLNKVKSLRKRLKSKPTSYLVTKLMESSLISQMDEAKNDLIISLTSTFSERPKKLYI